MLKFKTSKPTKWAGPKCPLRNMKKKVSLTELASFALFNKNSPKKFPKTTDYRKCKCKSESKLRLSLKNESLLIVFYSFPVNLIVTKDFFCQTNNYKLA
jgi:hypothetical protein